MHSEMREDVREREGDLRRRGEEWGAVRSHLHDKYPECVERDWKKYIKMHKERKGMIDED